jgi:adenylate cyclase
MSKAFVDHLWGNPHRLGAFALEGFEEAVEVYRPV